MQDNCIEHRCIARGVHRTRGMTFQRLLTSVLAMAIISACARATATGPAVGASDTPARGRTGAANAGAMATTAELQRIYRDMGLVAGNGAIPFVGSVTFLASPHPDTTLVLLAVSLPPRALAFTREGDRYSAEYVVNVDVRRGTALAAHVTSKETVRVPTFRETSRSDESVIWQQFLRLPAGRYGLGIGIRDEAAMRSGSEEVVLDVPRLAAGQLASPLAVYEAIPRTSTDSLPRLLARPRSTATFGADSQLAVYLEAAGADAPSAVTLHVIGEGNVELWKGPAELTARNAVRSATVVIPVTRLGVGVSTLLVTAVGRPDTARTRLFVSLGEDLPIATFDELLSALRYFAASDRLRNLKDAPPEKRAELWARFLEQTDPNPGTPEHEGLRDYFLRIRTANARFREDGPIGWQTDRGMTYIGLGEPDNLYDSALQDPTARVRQQIWEYRALRLQLLFTDQTGFGRYRLSASQRSEVESLIRRKLVLQTP